MRRVRLSALNSHVYVQSLRCIPAHPQAAGTASPHVVTTAGGHDHGHVTAVKAGVTASTLALTLALASETSRQSMRHPLICLGCAGNDTPPEARSTPNSRGGSEQR